MKNEILIKINEAVDFITKSLNFKPEIALILGSGLGDMADEVENPTIIDYKDIPNFPVSTVEGHKSRFVFGDLAGKKVAVMQGRFHYYEGYKPQEVVFPVWVMKALGITKLIVTNAAGGVNTSYKPGQLMLIRDHINFAGINPMIGPNISEFGPRFFDMSNAYNKNLRQIAKNCAAKLNLEIQEGNYIYLSGPNYETPAEIRAFRILGADAVGMSTVPEVLAANHCGVSVLGISCISNMAAGILDQPLNHQEVMETADRVKHDFIEFVTAIVKEI